MMTSLDRHLSALDIEPHGRGLNAAMLVSSALGLSGTPILGGPKDHGPPFSPRDLLARVHTWYNENYGDRMKIDMSPGTVLLHLHGNLWKIRIPKFWGSMDVFVDRSLTNEGVSMGVRAPITHNALCSIKGLTQAYANKLTDQELRLIQRAFVGGIQAMAGMDNLKGHLLFDEARADYRHSIDALFSGRELGKARWESLQCIEKILKGLLARDGHGYPTYGPKGHDIVHLGELAQEHLEINIPSDLLASMKCSAGVRYGEITSTRDEALSAHNALIRILLLLATKKTHQRKQRKQGSESTFPVHF